MKTKEEPNEFKKDVKTSEKHCELTAEQLKEVTGGSAGGYCANPGRCFCMVARECIRGNWGNGEERKRRLRAAGYDYALIQNVVNMMLNDPTRHPSSCWL